jgi:hypothetical protein
MHPAIVGRPGALPMLYHNGSIDYVISRKFSIGVKYGFMFYKAPPDAKVFSNNSYNYTYYGSDLDRNDFKGKYIQHTVALVFKHFMRKRGFIAPVGRYFTYGVYYQYAVNHFTTVSEYGYDNYTGAYTYNVQGKMAVTHTAGILLGTGRTFVVANRIVLDLGANINVSPYIVKVKDSGNEAFFGFAQRELILRNLLQIYLGIGVLAF